MASKSIDLKMQLDIKGYLSTLKTLDKDQAKQFTKMMAEQQKNNRAALKARVDAEKNAAKKSAVAWNDIYGIAVRALTVRAVANVAKSFASLGQEVADMRNQLTDAATRTGMSIKTLAALEHAAKGAGLEFSTLESSLNMFPKRMADMARGTGDAKVAFEQLDIQVSANDGHLRASNEVFAETISKLQGLESPTERAALAAQLFGRSGTQLIQALGTGDLEDWVDQVERFGLDIGPEAVDSAARYQRSMAEMSATIRKGKGALVDYLDITDKLEDFMVGIVAATTFGGELVSGLTDTFEVMAASAAFAFGSLPAVAQAAFDNMGDFAAMEAAINSIFLDSEEAKRLKAMQDALNDQGGAIARATAAAKEQAAAMLKSRELVKGYAAGMGEANAGNIDFTGGADDAATEAEKLAAALEKINFKSHAENTAEAAEEMALKLAIALEPYNTALEEVISNKIKILSLDEQEIANASTKAEKMETGLALAEEIGDKSIQVAEDVMSFEKDRLTAELDAVTETVEAIEERRIAALKAVQNAETDHDRATAMLRLAKINAEKTAAKAEEAEVKQRLQRVYRAEKAVTLTKITMETAAAVMKGYAMFGPPPSPAGIAAAIAAGVAGVTQAAVVAATPIPTYHTGGLIRAAALQPDEQMILARTGEAVLNQRAAESLGAEGVEALNQGTEPAAAIQQIVFDGRVIDTMVARVIDAGGRVSARINAGRRAPGISMVYGV